MQPFLWKKLLERGTLSVAALAYADQPALVAESEAQAQAILEVCSGYAGEHGFAFVQRINSYLQSTYLGAVISTGALTPSITAMLAPRSPTRLLSQSSEWAAAAADMALA
jgi:hypothetical protein